MSVNTFLHETERVETIDDAESVLLDGGEHGAYQRESCRLRDVDDETEVEQHYASIVAP